MATLTITGAQPTPPQVLLDELVADATALAPGLTTTLPGSLIEDLSSTATGALIIQDSAYVDLVNSVSPYTANPFILLQLGNVYGVEQGIGSNTSVYVTFAGTPGYVISVGFIVSDGTYQYIVQDAGVIDSGGYSDPIYCLATISGSWAIPEHTVTELITSVPVSITLSCTNNSTGVPGASAQTLESYQAQVIQAGYAEAQGVPAFLKTLLQRVSGVQPNLISVRPLDGGWQILVGGGDPYAVGNAIYQGIPNINDLQAASTIGTTVTIDIYEYPDIYAITFVVPTLQTVAINCTWNAISSANIVANDVVISLVAPAFVSYINSIYVGQAISILELQTTFISAVSNILPETAISELIFTVYIDSMEIDPPSNGCLVSGDPEGYFFTTLADITITQA
jgi:hypothetical protein